MSEFSPEELSQKEHYDAFETYHAEYSDKWTTIYRDRFIHNPMMADLNLAGMTALEAMAGAGAASTYLKERGAKPLGLDISERQISLYRECHPDCDAICGSILNSGLEGESLDLVVAVGGLHHLYPHVDRCIAEIHRILKPGGYFCFCDPHTSSLMDRLRQIWYRFDPVFAEGEAAINIEELLVKNKQLFEIEVVKFVGNVAYLGVFNSSVFRVPSGLKNLYAAPFMELEAFLNRLLPRILACCVVCRWRKRL